MNMINAKVADPCASSRPDETEHVPESLGRQESVDASRRGHLRRLLELAPPVSGLGHLRGGLTIVIPTYDEEVRTRTLPLALRAVAAQRLPGSLLVVVADNGMSARQRATVTETARSVGLDLHVVDARPSRDDQRSAPYARNVALREIRHRARHDPRFRASQILLLDDDAAPLPGAIQAMDAARRAHHDAVAVIGVSRTVPTLDDDVFRRHAEHGLAEGGALPMPSLYGTRGVDVGALVAFSGEVSTKSNCLLLDARVVFDLLDGAGDAFVAYPNGTVDDMILGAALNRRGTVVRARGAAVLDQEPAPGRGFRRQRSRFGRDHAILLSDLVQVGHAEHRAQGIMVLEPSSIGWSQHLLPAPGVTGVVIHPAELGPTLEHLSHMVREGALQGFDPDYERGPLAEGLRIGSRVLAFIERQLDRSHVVARPDLPKWVPLPDDPSSRWSMDSRAAQLAGNLMGLHDIRSEAHDGLPQCFLLGGRQHVAWGASSG